MAFRDWQDVEASDHLILPIRGKRYTVPKVGHLDGIRIREEWAKIAAGGKPTVGNTDVMDMLLGRELVEEMEADNVPPEAIVHAATVAGVDFQQGRDAAEEMWEHGPSPEALAAALKVAAAAYEDSTTSPSTPPLAPTSSTRPRASTASTRSPKPPVRRSSGKRSLPTRGSSSPTSSPSTDSTL